MDEKDQRIQELSGQLKRAQDALLVVEYYNRIHNDFEAYLLAIAHWGLGERDMPNVDDFLKGFTDTDVLVNMIRERRK